MAFDFGRARKYLQSFNLSKLFIEEMGWDLPAANLAITLNDAPLQLTSIAQKRGLAVYACPPLPDGQLPDYATRRKIESQVRKSAHEHLIIFTNAERSLQKWQWVRHEPGRPAASREYDYAVGQPGDLLLQRLQHAVFTLEEEETLTIIDATSRVRATFDLERVTRRFYDRFKSEHAAFTEFLKGIPEEGMQRWYVSVTLNRLMFVYFIQKKGFMNDDPDSLRNKLVESSYRGKDRFYRDFLCPLFFEGFARKESERSAEINQLLGKVPYLDGGIFQRHQIEALHGQTIQIPDAAFQRLFDFFDQYRWHLDERPLRADNEINPDVLGYIFEKYINQKQMGAYYTKEDITEYISKSTILPYIFDHARHLHKEIFEGEDSIWALLPADPDRYIYPAARHGVDLPLPAEIAAGLEDVNQRTEWNKPAPPEYALPTEIWREVASRRQRYEEVRGKLANGEIREINDFITYNLDIRQFAQDAIESLPTPEALRAFLRVTATIRVLDPTVGSGAFLFAALNILEPLYEALFGRMQAFLDELDRSGEKHRPEKMQNFRKILDQMAQHPNPRYFILKSIMIYNLFGVDIMEEAVEICKLRLFLKLAAQIERVDQIEPLPDIDFNIRAGNTLVGFATKEDVRQALTTQAGKGGAVQDKMVLFDDDREALGRIEEQAEDVERLYRLLQSQQTELGGVVTQENKQALRQQLNALEDELNRLLARQYGVDPGKTQEYQRWLNTHKSFHWFIEFYGIMKSDRFDVIIGNPPYVELSAIQDYKVVGFKTEQSGNLYALCLERSINMLSNRGLIGMVVQQPFVSTKRMVVAREVILQNATSVYSSTYDDRPSKLFDGIYHSRNAIVLVQKGRPNNGTELYVTPYQKWYKEERKYLFEKLCYVKSQNHPSLGIFPKMGSPLEESILSKVISQPGYFSKWIYPINTEYRVYYKITGVGHWFTITTRPPRFIRQGEESASTRESWICFRDQPIRDRAFSLLNSSLFYWFYQLRTNCRDFNPSDYRTFPIPNKLDLDDLSGLAKILQKKLDISSSIVSVSHSKTGSIEYEQFRPREAKTILDEIDHMLARHYGFTDEELDFIINYDIKYRMGREGEEGKDGEA